MLTGCEKLWKLLIEKNMKNSLFMNKSTKPMMIQGLCFSLCFFAFQLTEFTVNDRAEILFGAKWVNTVYSVGIACTALGFLSFHCFGDYLPVSENERLSFALLG